MTKNSTTIDAFTSDQPEQVFRRATHSRSLSHHSDGPLKQAGVFGHQSDEFGIGLITGEACLIGIPRPQHIARTHTKLDQHIPDLILREWVRCVLAIGMCDSLFLEQSDRFATGTSGLGTNEQHGVSYT
jgi:hypothetical protein